MVTQIVGTHRLVKQVTLVVGGIPHKLSIIATVTNQGKTRWLMIDEAFNSDKLIEFWKC